MNPLTVSAQFAAYVWYTEVSHGPKPHDEAVQFAQRNWASFLPSAHEGWGKLLLRLARPRHVERGRMRRHDTARRSCAVRIQ